jgi:hypothetical protein
MYRLAPFSSRPTRSSRRAARMASRRRARFSTTLGKTPIVSVRGRRYRPIWADRFPQFLSASREPWNISNQFEECEGAFWHRAILFGSFCRFATISGCVHPESWFSGAQDMRFTPLPRRTGRGNHWCAMSISRSSAISLVGVGHPRYAKTCSSTIH